MYMSYDKIVHTKPSGFGVLILNYIVIRQSCFLDCYETNHNLFIHIINLLYIINQGTNVQGYDQFSDIWNILLHMYA